MFCCFSLYCAVQKGNQILRIYVRAAFCKHILVYRGVARSGKQQYANDVDKPLVLFFVLRCSEKQQQQQQQQNAWIFDLIHRRISNFNRVCRLIFFSLGDNFVFWYEISKNYSYILMCFPIPGCAQRNKHSDHGYNDLQNMTSRENPLILSKSRRYKDL